MKSILFLLLIIITSYLTAEIINIPYDQLSIQAGIDIAVDSDTVLVHPGIYYENINYSGKRISVASLFITTQDTIYISETVIDGYQIGSVVTFVNDEDSTAVLCGFTITNGFNVKGGGIYSYDSSPKLLNLIITENNISGGPWNYGAGIYMWRSSSVLNNVIITGNISSGYSRNYGGGIFCHDSSPHLINVTIKNNEVSGGLWNQGGGMKCQSDSNPYFYNVTIENNIAFGGSWNYGGGLFISHCSAELHNVLVSNNSVWGEQNNNGAGIFCDHSYPNTNIYNTTIVNNIVENGSSQTGGLYCRGDYQVNLTNCIIWNNSPSEVSGNPSIDYSDIQGGWVGSGNIDADPLFVNNCNNFHLTENSPCIDTGDPNFPFDPDGTIVDMGAFYFNQIGTSSESFIQTEEFSVSNFPNPFNPSTTIEFSIQNYSKIELSIYNIKGQKIITVANNEFSKGSHSIFWNGCDENNKPASSGIYYYKLIVNGKTEAVKKCLLLK